jgi:hypothetical protein
MELPGIFIMDRLAVAVLIVITALVFHGGLAPSAFAKEKRFAPTHEQSLVTAEAGSASADRSAAF